MSRSSQQPDYRSDVSSSYSVLRRSAGGDIVVDGGNSKFDGDGARAERLGKRGVGYVDVGVPPPAAAGAYDLVGTVGSFTPGQSIQLFGLAAVVWPGSFLASLSRLVSFVHQ